MSKTKSIVLIALLLISNYCLCQVESVVIDKNTNEVIPYVNIWVEGEENGTSSNENGEFVLYVDESKFVIFSAIGYETIHIKANLIEETIALRQDENLLNEVSIITQKQNLELKIGKFKKSKINHYFSCDKSPWIVARFFQYEKRYHKTPYIKKIKLLTDSEIKNAKFNLRLYNVDENGKPGNYLYQDNIIGFAKKGNKYTEIDISDLKIQFPESGFFVAVEWLIIEENKFEYNFKDNKTKEMINSISYLPRLGFISAETNDNSWNYRKGKWYKAHENRYLGQKYNYKYSLLAIELTLTN